LQAQGIKSDNYTKTDKIIYIHVRNNPGNLKIKKDSARLKYGVSGRPTLEFSICHFSFNCVIDAKPRGKLVTACIIEMIENIHNYLFIYRITLLTT
jgi:hypothetical protein